MNHDSSTTASDPNVSRSDALLVAACRAGERHAFVEIVQRHQSLVCAVAYNVTGRLEVSEELAQDTFVTAWRKMDELREPAKLRGWLTRIAHALAVDWVRRQKPGAALDALDNFASPEAAPDEAAAASEENALVWKALEALPEATRLPLILFYREGQSIAAVAAAMELSEDAVKQRLSRGRAALRDRLTEVAESVLGRTRPNAVFTFVVMAAIGALTAPAALAATAFASASALAPGTATAAAAQSTVTSSTTSLFATMSISKSTPAIAAALVAFCIPVGWSARDHRHSPDIPSDSRAAAALHAKAAKPDFKSSSLYAEWQRLHDEHGTTKEAMPALYQAISEIKDTFRRRAFRAALIAEWAELDGPGALAHFRGMGKNDLAEQAMREWMLRDPRPAVAALMSCGPGWESIGGALLGDIARLAPELMPAVAAQLPKSEKNRGNTGVKDAFATLAAKDLTFARAQAEALTGPHRDQALAGVAAAWVVQDPQAALAWAKALPEGETRNVGLRGLLTAWAGTDPAAALDHAGLVPPGGDRMSYSSDIASQVLSAAAAKDFSATMRWLKENPGKIGIPSLNGMMSLLSDKLAADTAGTLVFLQNEAPAEMSHVMRNALLNQGYNRAAEIRAWLDAQPPGSFVDETRAALINGTAWHDPDALVAWVNDMPAEQKTPEKLKEIAQRLLNGGGDLSRIDELIATSPPALSEALILQGFMGSSNGWPGGDVTPWLARLEQVPASERGLASSVLAGNWTATDPEAAVAWAAALPDEAARQQSYAAIARRWAQADSYETSQWIASLPAGGERDAATRSLVYEVAASEPDSAWKWARQITGAQARFDAMGASLAAMAKTDPAAGRAALQQITDLTAGDRAYFQTVLENTTRSPGQPLSAPASR